MSEWKGTEPIMDTGDKIAEQITELLSTKQREYGDAVQNMDRLAEVWNWYIDRHPGKLTGKDVALLNVLFKISRELGKHKPDNLDDIIGWATIAKQCAEVEG